ncbi:hypothetical protein, unlikely [Trypanosoma congolense IL3000]|uniref:Uncharacterized protein n=1 Tax=Trypanosoma congolense (strain IL3000) TaxID=1068625 RepID=F9WA75_TRYCI|nr:hypothetical protein, unlikely [Trypanosoma congolense IL3000]
MTHTHRFGRTLGVFGGYVILSLSHSPNSAPLISFLSFFPRKSEATKQVTYMKILVLRLWLWLLFFDFAMEISRKSGLPVVPNVFTQFLVRRKPLITLQAPKLHALYNHVIIECWFSRVVFFDVFYHLPVGAEPFLTVTTLHPFTILFCP